MATGVGGIGAAVTVAKVTGHGREAARFQRGAEDVFNLLRRVRRGLRRDDHQSVLVGDNS
jgi:hypothetical protein